MTPEQIVRSRYPNARAEQSPPAFETGQSGSHIPGAWVIRVTQGPGAEIGVGPNEQAAWQAAAQKVKVDTCLAKTQLWVQYLLAHGYRRSSEDENALTHPSDPELFANVIPRTGTLHLSPKLAQQIAELADGQGNPPIT
jgi:hypothetical protein